MDAKKRFSEEQISGLLGEAEAGMAIKGLCRWHGCSEAVYDLWRSKSGDMSVPDAKRLNDLETGKARLNKLLADAYRVQLCQIQPGKPNQNIYVESFNGRRHDECLDEHWLPTLLHAPTQYGGWGRRMMLRNT